MTVYITELKDLAIFVAQLVREGVTFEAVEDDGRYKVTLTGGC
jgi:hypothetical protein